MTACCKGENQRKVDMMGGLVRRGGCEDRFWRRQMCKRAHTANIGRREIRHRPVDFDRERERAEGREGKIAPRRIQV